MSEEESIVLPPEETIIQYLNRERKRIGISQKEIGDALSLDQTNVSRLLRGESRLRYEDACGITLLILKHVSPIPDEPVSRHYVSSEDVEFIYADEPILEAVKKMKDGGFTQLPVRERLTKKCIGIITDWGLLRIMLHPPKSTSKEKWLQEVRNMQINDKLLEDAKLIDQVPIYPSDSPLIEVAEGLMHHYAVLVQEEITERKIGIITRADFLKLLIQE
jgi:predicted transcriptional regulator